MNKRKVTNEMATKELKKGFNNAKSIVKDDTKLERFIMRFSKSWKSNTFAKDIVNDVELLFSLVKDYKSGAYKEVPVGTIVAIISALVYVINPFDLIPDAIPGIGVLDDAAVVVACVKLIQSDIEKYKNWLKNNPKNKGAKTTSQKTTSKKPTSQKATVKRTTCKKPTSQKATAKRTTSKKPTTKKTTSKKA